MPEFWWRGEKPAGESTVKVLINGEQVLNAETRVGNNNWKVGKSYRPRPGDLYLGEPSGYHVQFGIADASGEMVVKIQDPKIKSYPRKTLQSYAALAHQAPIKYDSVSGECQVIYTFERAGFQSLG